MMSAIEQIEARKQAEEKSADPPTPKPEAKPAAASTSAAASPRRDSNSVTLILDPHVYAHFAEKAKVDDRTISKYIARHLRGFVDEIKGKEKF